MLIIAHLCICTILLKKLFISLFLFTLLRVGFYIPQVYLVVLPLFLDAVYIGSLCPLLKFPLVFSILVLSLDKEIGVKYEDTTGIKNMTKRKIGITIILLIL